MDEVRAALGVGECPVPEGSDGDQHPQLARTSLFHRIDAARAANACLWLAARAGAGKSTLVRSYAQARGVALVTYRLSAVDDNPVAFFSALARVVERAVPATDGALPVSAGEIGPAFQIIARRYFDALFARLRQPAILLFDDFHELPHDAFAAAAILPCLDTGHAPSCPACV